MERPKLTEREKQVIRLIAHGLANKEIAYRLGISPHTVKDYVTSAMNKLHADTRAQVVATATRKGLLNTDPSEQDDPNGPGQTGQSK